MRKLKKYNLGGIQLGSMLVDPIISTIPDNTYTDMEGNIIGSNPGKLEAGLSGAAKGAAAGAMFGPAGAIIGGGFGLTMGLINQNKEKKALDKRTIEANANIGTKRRLGGPNVSANNIVATNSDMYAHGGTIKEDSLTPNAELELNEQFMLPNGIVGEVDGPAHEEGGIEVNLPEGTLVFSDRLKSGNKTFAQKAKSINNKIAKSDKQNTQASKNTKMLFQKQLTNLFNEQEEMKKIKIPTEKFDLGGMVSPDKLAFASQMGSILAQNNTLNKVPRPRTIKPVSFTAGVRPNRIDLSSERSMIDSEAAAAMQGISLGSGSFSTQASNRQSIMNRKLQAKGRSLQNQINTNTQLDNSYNAAVADAFNKSTQINLGIDQMNLDNDMNYNLWRAGNRSKMIASGADSMTNLFNNQTAHNNQLEYWNVLKNMYDPSVANDITKNSKLGSTDKQKRLLTLGKEVFTDSLPKEMYGGKISKKLRKFK